MSKRSAKGKRAAPKQERTIVRRVAARFDSAQTTDENRRHWAWADGLSADAAASPGIRRILRNRARYEVANNSYGQGIVDSLAYDCVGMGPRLQMLSTKSDNNNTLIETQFSAWAQAVGLAEKLRTFRSGRAVDGEVFGMMVNNPQIPVRVQLDIRLLEAEQVASADFAGIGENAVDGIRFDQFGNPTSYEVLKQHPGGMAFMPGESTPITAAKMLHFFVPRRPGQRRGIPDLTPALPLFAQLRRWTLSVLAAAETAADFAAILKTGSPADGETDSATPFENLEISKRMMQVLPAGWEMQQFKAEQPVSTYAEFKCEILDEIARGLLMPSNIARGNSSKYNFSSAKLDNISYKRAVEVDRERLTCQVLDRIFYEWVREAQLIEGYLPQSLRTITADLSHAWLWPSVEVGNPKDEGPSATERLTNGTSTMAQECGILGRDWQETADARAREAEYLRSKGLPVPWEQKAAPAAAPTAETKPTDDGDGEDDESDDEEETDPADQQKADAVTALAKVADRLAQNLLNGPAE